MPDALASATEAGRSKAAIRAVAVAKSLELIDEGHSPLQADTMAAEDAGVQRAAVMRWRKRALAPQSALPIEALLHRPSPGRPATAWDTPGADKAWRMWLGFYLRPEQPGSAACWREVRKTARVRGWTMPCEVMFRRRLYAEVPIEVITFRRKGVVETTKLFPHQVRTVAGMLPLDAVSGDGDKHAVFVRTADGRVIRPVGWYWQDVRTRKILGYDIGETENQDVVRMAFVGMVDDYGKPQLVVVDNTHAASSKWWSANRKRGWRSDAEQVPGIMEQLGIRVIHTHVVRELNGKGMGWGQAKPVERFFLDVSEGIDRHPLCAGAWAGPNPTEKPANYDNENAVPWETFLAAVADGVAEYNARPERRMEVASNGRSIDDVWAEEIVSTPVGRLTTEQRALLLLACESSQVKADGTFTLAAGKGTGLPANVYFHESLRALIVHRPENRRVVARFDPRNLHAGVEVFDTKMAWLCHAECLLPVGFLDTGGAREHNRARHQFLKATKAAANAQARVDEIREEYGVEPTTPAKGPAPKAVKIVRPAGAAGPAEAAEAETAREAREDRYERGLLRLINEH